MRSMVADVSMSLRPSEQSSIARALVERRLDDLDEVGIVRLVERAADVAEDFVAPRMAHRLGFGDLAGVFALADRRVVVRELPHALPA